jgi:hypothetical protein
MSLGARKPKNLNMILVIKASAEITNLLYWVYLQKKIVVNSHIILIVSLLLTCCINYLAFQSYVFERHLVKVNVPGEG